MSRLALLGAGFLLAAAIAGTAGGAAGGSLDASFDGDGKVVTDFGTSDNVGDVLVQPDGKIVVVGTTEERGEGNHLSDFAVARYNADGTLDPSFGGDGRVVTDSGAAQDRAYGAALQPDGRLVVAGLRSPATANSGDFALARYNPDGSLDTGFGDRGLLVTDFGETTELALAVLALPDGGIVAAGHTHAPGPEVVSDFALARFRADGSLDPAFNGDGRVVTDFGGFDIVFDAAAESDGRIVVVGYTSSPPDQNRKLAISRYDPDGSLDATLDGDGRVVTDLTGIDHEIATGVSVQADGKIVVASVGSVGVLARLQVLRYNRRGRLDPSFGSAGIATAGFQASFTSPQVTVQRNGKIVALGAARGGSGEPAAFAVGRFLPNGDADPNFGTGGAALADIGAADVPQAVAIQPDGKIVGAGSTSPVQFPGSEGDVALVRFLPGTCSVPSVRGRTLASARALLGAANCRLGRVRRVFSRRVKRNRIISQGLPAGRDAEDWAVVGVVVSKGSRDGRSTPRRG